MWIYVCVYAIVTRRLMNTTTEKSHSTSACVIHHYGQRTKRREIERERERVRVGKRFFGIQNDSHRPRRVYLSRNIHGYVCSNGKKHIFIVCVIHAAVYVCVSITTMSVFSARARDEYIILRRTVNNLGH